MVMALRQSPTTHFRRPLQLASDSVRFCSNRTRVKASIELCNPDDFEVQRLIGTYGYMNVTSYNIPPPEMGRLPNQPLGLDLGDFERRMSGQQLGEGGIQTRLYAGRISRGPRRGTRVILKAYPGRSTGGAEADAMAANELATHAILQDKSEEEICPNLVFLLGGFQTKTGEQWLVYRKDGQFTAADYAKEASTSMTKGATLGDSWEFLDLFDRSRPIKRRQIFIIKLLRGALTGLAYMHANGRLHQSLGPASVVINTMSEKDVYFLVPQLRDLAFSVDISDEAIFQRIKIGLSWRNNDNISDEFSGNLWRRARSAGAITPFEYKGFGIADDIYAAGLLMAYMIFIPLCEPGSIDGPSLQRLFESSFQLDLKAAREYCLADERWIEAVKFLDLGDGAGWELLQAMLNPDYRQRPIVEAVLNHRFMTGATL